MNTQWYSSAQHFLGEHRKVYANAAPENASTNPEDIAPEYRDLPGWDLPQDIMRWVGNRVRAIFNLPLSAVRTTVGLLNIAPHLGKNLQEAVVKNVTTAADMAKADGKIVWDSITALPREGIHTLQTGASDVMSGVRNRFSRWAESIKARDWKMPFRFAKETAITGISLGGVLPGIWQGGKHILMGNEAANDDKYQKNIVERNWNILKNDVTSVLTSTRDWFAQWAWKTPVEHGIIPIGESIAHGVHIAAGQTVPDVLRTGIPQTMLTGLPLFPETLSKAVKGKSDPFAPDFLTVSTLDEMIRKQPAANEGGGDAASSDEVQRLQQENEQLRAHIQNGQQAA